MINLIEMKSIVLNMKDFQDNTPLLIAIKLARKKPEMIEVIRKMIQKGADPNLVDKSNWTTLDEAVSQVHYVFNQKP